MKKEQASSTAYTVLQGMMLIAQKPEFTHLVSERNGQLGEMILNSSDEGKKRLKQINSPIGKWVGLLMERLLLPKISLHYVLRKVYIESRVRKAIADGATQIINLGAGFDTLLYRLAEENHSLNCIEIDHPATHADKKAALARPDLKRDNLHFLPVDFSHQTFEQELGQCPHFDAAQKTVCIVEGVLMYLTSEQVHRLMLSLQSLLSHSKCYLVFTALEPTHLNPQSVGLFLPLYLKLKGEPLNWFCEAEKLTEFMSEADFQVTETAHGMDFCLEFMPDYSGTVHRGEYGAVAVSNWAKKVVNDGN